MKLSKWATMCVLMKDGKVVQTETPENLSISPANDYVHDFIDNADKTKVMSVRNIMITPSSIVRINDSIDYAIREMRKNNLSSVVVIDNDLHLSGILSIRQALQAYQSAQPISQVLQKEIATVSPDVMVADIIPLASEAAYPIAVTDENNVLLGIVTKASILSSLI
jgi:glycine betaine/proline transport system ATP-binding protein